jgi:hypothetical protein
LNCLSPLLLPRQTYNIGCLGMDGQATGSLELPGHWDPGGTWLAQAEVLQPDGQFLRSNSAIADVIAP